MTTTLKSFKELAEMKALRGVRIRDEDIQDYINPEPPAISTPTAPQKYLNGKVIKVVVPLDPLELCGYTPTDDVKMKLHIKVGDRNLLAEIATKSLRKALTLIRETGPEGCFAILQGKLIGDEIVEVGLVCQSKAKPAEQAPTPTRNDGGVRW